MGSVIRLAMTSLAVVRIKDTVGKLATYAALLAVAAMIATAGAGFLVAALWTWLASIYTPLLASLLVGAGFLVIALAVYGYGSYVRHRKPRPDMVALPAAALAEISSRPVQTSTVLKLAAVLAGVGYVAGRVLVRR